MPLAPTRRTVKRGFFRTLLDLSVRVSPEDFLLEECPDFFS